MTRQVYSVRVVTQGGTRFELQYVARRAVDAVRAASRDVRAEGYKVAWAVWNGAKPLSECEQGGIRWV